MHYFNKKKTLKMPLCTVKSSIKTLYNKIKHYFGKLLLLKPNARLAHTIYIKPKSIPYAGRSHEVVGFIALLLSCGYGWWLEQLLLYNILYIDCTLINIRK